MKFERNHPRKVRCLLLLGVLVWSLFIWSNSCRPAAASANQSLQVLACLQPVFEALHIPAELGHVLVRKAAHMTEFLVLGLLWMSALLRRPDRRVGGSMFTAASFCLMTALVDESIQLIAPGRGSLVTDIWIDFGGGCIGILLMSVVHQRFASRCGSSAAETGSEGP